MYWIQMPGVIYFLGQLTPLSFEQYPFSPDILSLSPGASEERTFQYPSDWLGLGAGVYPVAGVSRDPHFQLSTPIFIAVGSTIPQYPLTGFFPLADIMNVTNDDSSIVLTAIRIDENSFLQRIHIELEENTEMILIDVNDGYEWPLMRANELYFYVEDSINQYDFELFWETQSGLKYLIPFDETFSIDDSGYSQMHLVLYLNELPVDTVTQAFTSFTGLATEKEAHILEQIDISCYPNPFNPTTTIQYELPQRSEVQLTIYDLLGREVTTLLLETQDVGYKSVQWDATNVQGQEVGTGVYFYQIKVGDFVQTRKMVLLK